MTRTLPYAVAAIIISALASPALSWGWGACIVCLAWGAHAAIEHALMDDEDEGDE